MTYTIIIALIISFFAIIKQINEYERGVVFTFGKISGTRNPGWRPILPVVQRMMKVDIRTKTVDVPNQEVITRDNIPVYINAVVYYKITDPIKSILEVENYRYAVSQLAQTTMRNSVAERTLDELLQKRNEIAEGIKLDLDGKTDPWGIQVEMLELKDVIIPDNLKRTISKEAEAEREKRAVIIKAEGDMIASDNLAAAAKTLNATPGAMHLRTLQAVNDLSSDQSNTTIWMIPIEVLDAVRGFSNTMKK